MSELSTKSFEDDLFHENQNSADTESDRGSEVAGGEAGGVSTVTNVTSKINDDGNDEGNDSAYDEPYGDSYGGDIMTSSPERTTAAASSSSLIKEPLSSGRKRAPILNDVDDDGDSIDDQDSDNLLAQSPSRSGTDGAVVKAGARSEDEVNDEDEGKEDLDDDDEHDGELQGQEKNGSKSGGNDSGDMPGGQGGLVPGTTGSALLNGQNVALMNQVSAQMTAAATAPSALNFNAAQMQAQNIDTSRLVNLPSHAIVNQQMLGQMGQMQMLGQHQQMSGQAPSNFVNAASLQLATNPHQQAVQQSFPQSVLAGNSPSATATASFGNLSGPNAELLFQGLIAQSKVQNNSRTNATNQLYGLTPSTGLSANMNIAATNVSGMSSSINSNINTTVQEKPKEQSPADAYRDFSRIPMSDDPDGATLHASTGKEPPFPVKLHRILSNPDYSDFISWLPHGRSWRVLKPKAFEEKIVPRYFRHTKYASFMRQVNGWGFKRMTQGPDHNSYYHELFLRGLPHLCYKMRRPARAKLGAGDADANPDFYRLSLVAPLPNDNGANNPGLAASLPTPSTTPGTPVRTTEQSLNGMDKKEDHNTTRVRNSSNIAAAAAKASLSQNSPASFKHQTIGNYAQLSGLNGMNGITSMHGIAGMNGMASPDRTGLSSASVTSNEISQLDALRKRREELVRQLKGLQSQDTTQAAQQNDSMSFRNQMNPYGNYQTGAVNPATTHYIPNQYQQIQQMAMGAENNSASQMGAGLLQIPGFNIPGQRHMNIGNLVGNSAPTAAGMNQQYLIQSNPNAAAGNVAMGTNNMLPSLNLNMMMQNQMGGLQLPNQVNSYQQYQLQQQPSQPHDPQQQANQFSGSLQKGPL